MHAFVHKFGLVSHGFDSYDNLFLPGKALFECVHFLKLFALNCEFLGGLEAMLRGRTTRRTVLRGPRHVKASH